MTAFGSIDPGAGLIKIDCWFVVHRGDPRVPAYSRRPRVRVTAGEPALDRNERAIRLKVDLPLALFEPPSLAASIRVEAPREAVSIDASAVAEAVRQVIGMDVTIAVVDPEADE